MKNNPMRGIVFFVCKNYIEKVKSAWYIINLLQDRRHSENGLLMNVERNYRMMLTMVSQHVILLKSQRAAQ
ncbi:hypothetical protein WQ57_03205 [Mesobacillus campisalis]|uniref:Uncharacterized protein n=1 Tax=Mesobacillus campisalis TaxID=1408103 RepID=A0A0M2SZZ4_9BACI|nr:hypothetical protein WQ57_03205 [Mesobacillus campisalis]